MTTGAEALSALQFSFSNFAGTAFVVNPCREELKERLLVACENKAPRSVVQSIINELKELSPTIAASKGSLLRSKWMLYVSCARSRDARP